MANKDILMREIDKLGLVLQAVLSKVMLLSETNSDANLSVITNEDLKKEINVDLSEILETPDELLVDLLKSKGFTDSNLNDLIRIIFYLTKSNQKINDLNNAIELNRKSMVIKAYLNTKNIAYFSTENLR